VTIRWLNGLIQAFEKHVPVPRQLPKVAVGTWMLVMLSFAVLFGFFTVRCSMIERRVMASWGEFPFWWLKWMCFAGVVVFAAEAVGAYRVLRRIHRGEHGLCPICGYDLRATPTRCPECGAATGASDVR
jgi:hypothetical protein